MIKQKYTDWYLSSQVTITQKVEITEHHSCFFFRRNDKKLVLDLLLLIWSYACQTYLVQFQTYIASF